MMADHVVCRCDAYKFPHQLQGGKCSGAMWLDQKHAGHTHCEKCPMHHVASTGHGCGLLLSWVFTNNHDKPKLDKCAAFNAEKGKK